ncbi:heme lyase NrfEFG subunit NrfF [Aggregatibacter actinomycetemcomitans]|uniref:heme lyase NrfEFG subunit NrfF n=1 Tax=Aggregatibacter actinomycetemcomitans TaxID=714 RepID=UPI00022AC03E|nr:heme lyase NrfEFG subunit NrfF [Aggregatibacter actinomycetemcomitans]KOE69587.1 nitrite reductase [Aggregatibacter actinomycetemcomitans serotype f str. D18P1]KYK89239.1 nitrite reductase [Aggregatibacter actinomycetemcomitans serotype f str. SC29R]MBN6061264.1 heme lyase NrfEFG subunit NrfF [Aggregatibacter actinomycetemcomitans]OZV18918.1 heme lyase NrfEFG subunit NrfF [Aggregatibacter actinomycetemcomitans]UEL53472.1 heme lyase NrfEFG subunit NrfF [Aggregatibacter actinomycetemcomitans]
MKRFLALFFLLISVGAFAEMVDTFEFHNPADRARAVELAKSLRCPQCQNQNLVESNSPIAYDLRLEVYNMVNEGKTNQQIIDAMTARFGNFVNYKPPFQWNTALLWLLPAGLLLMAFGLIWNSARSSPSLKSEKQLANPPHFHAIQEKSAVKFERKSTLIVFTLLLIVSLVYYFSLDRFARAKQGERAQIAQLNHQIETPEENKTEAIIGKLQDKLRQNPNHGENWIKLGDAYMQNNDFDSALICYTNAEKIEGRKPTILGLMAMSLYLQANQQVTPQVQQLVEDVLKQDRKEVSVLSLLAAEALKTRDYSTALDYWQQILDSGNAAVDRRAIIQKMKMVDFMQKGNMQ